MADWADLRQKVIDLYQAGKFIPYLNVFRWPEGSQSNGAIFSMIWKTRKLDFNLTHAWLYGPKGLIDDTNANMTAFVNTLTEAMPWPSDSSGDETGTLDDAYTDLVEFENEQEDP